MLLLDFQAHQGSSLPSALVGAQHAFLQAISSRKHSYCQPNSVPLQHDHACPCRQPPCHAPAVLHQYSCCQTQSSRCSVATGASNTGSSAAPNVDSLHHIAHRDMQPCCYGVQCCRVHAKGLLAQLLHHFKCSASSREPNSSLTCQHVDSR